MNRFALRVLGVKRVDQREAASQRNRLAQLIPPGPEQVQGLEGHLHVAVTVQSGRDGVDSHRVQSNRLVSVALVILGLQVRSGQAWASDPATATAGADDALRALGRGAATTPRTGVERRTTS